MPKRRLEPLVVGVRAGEVAVVGEPVVLRRPPAAGQRAADLPEFEVLRRQRRLAARPQDVEVAVLAAEVDPAVADARRRRDRAAERRRERPRLALARQRHDVQAAVQPAVHRLRRAAGSARRSTGSRPAARVCLLSGACLQRPKPASGRQRYTSPPRRLTDEKLSRPGRLIAVSRARHEVGLRPCRRRGGGSRRGPRCRGGATGDTPFRPRRCSGRTSPDTPCRRTRARRRSRAASARSPASSQPHRPPAGRHDDRVLRTWPGPSSSRTGRASRRGCPSMFSQSSPLQRSPSKPSTSWTKSHVQQIVPSGRHGVDPGAERGEVHAAVADHRRAEDRLAAANLLDHGSRRRGEHVVRAGRRAEVEVAADNRRRGDVVAVLVAAPGLAPPEDLEACRRRSQKTTPEPSTT